MSEWTEAEYSEFERLVDMASSCDQMDRINARMDMPKFIEKHGRHKCDKMYEKLMAEE